MVQYCSRDCQVAHRPKHKKACQQRAAELFDEELFQDPPDGPECPICMLPLPFEDDRIHFQSCCGKFICLGCAYAQVKEDVQRGKHLLDCGACAFCRTPATPVEKEVVDQMNKCVERNDATSMEQLAILYMNGKMGLQKDLDKAMELFRKAGELGCASAYRWLGNYYEDGLEKDAKKSKHYLELAAIRGDLESRHGLGCLEGENRNNIRASKHFLISAKAGYEPSLDPVKLSFQHGFITKDEFAAALRGYQKQHDDRKSVMREEALDFDVNDF